MHHQIYSIKRLGQLYTLQKLCLYELLIHNKLFSPKSSLRGTQLSTQNTPHLFEVLVPYRQWKIRKADLDVASFYGSSK